MRLEMRRRRSEAAAVDGVACRRPSILLVGDGAAREGSPTACLLERWFEVRTAAGPDEAEEALRAGAADLLILDIARRAGRGVRDCRRLAEAQGAPIIVVGEAVAVADRVLCLELGADDFIAKPAGDRELVARIRAVLRGRSRAREAARRGRVERCFAGHTFNLVERSLRSPSGDLTRLSWTDCALLKVFLDHPRQIMTRPQIARLTGGAATNAAIRNVDIQVSRLRQRLEACGSPELIHTVRRIGYLFEAGVGHR